jgi:hypothetical protein
MGNKFEVYAWVGEGGVNDTSPRGLRNIHWEIIYEGRNIIFALLTMWKLKQKGVGCVKMYWR